MAYSFYRSITIDHTQVGGSDVTSYTLLVTGTISTLKTVGNGGNVQNSSGFDIVFATDTAGSSLLNWEMNSYDPTTGFFIAYVAVGTVSHTADTTIYMVYGNSAISTFQGGSLGAAWSSSYWQIYHLQEASNPYKDSTGNALDSTAGTNPSQVTGLWGKAQSFAGGSSQYIPFPNKGLAPTPCTISGWMKWSGLEAFLVDTRNTSASCGYIAPFSDNATAPNKVSAYYNNNGPISSSGNFNDGNWHYFVCVNQGGTGTWRIYADDTQVASVTGSTAANVTIGTGRMGSVFDGSIFGTSTNQEVRISNVDLTDRKTIDYNNQKSGSTLVTIGSEQTPAGQVNRTVSDTLTLSDSEIIQLVLNFNITGDTNAGNWADAVAFTLGVPGIAASDTLTLSDSLTVSIDYWLRFNDTISLADQFPNAPAMSMMAFADALTLSDSNAEQVNVVLSFNDTLALSDTVSLVEIILLRISDTFTLSDLFGFNVPVSRQLSDNFIWRDAQIVKWSSTLPAFSDTLTLSDNVTVANNPAWTVLSEVLSDSFTFIDSFRFNAAILNSINDSFTFSDLIQINNSFNPFNQSISDTFSFTDTVLVSTSGGKLQFADSFIFSDSILVQNATAFNSYIRRYLNDEPLS